MAQIMLLEDKIEAMITPVLDGLAFRLVRVLFGNGTLQIMAEPVDETHTMTVEDCAVISRTISAVLDVEDPIKGRFTLEVSSPGLSRPLVRPQDYTRFTGEMAKISTKMLLDGRKRFRGKLRGLDEAGRVLIDTPFGAQAIDYDAIDTAKLDPSEFFSSPFKHRKKG